MVGDWLKLEFIALFFTKLAQDDLGDTRRVKFWAKYVPLIENIHFALGTYAKYSQERDFVELRKKLKGLTVSLEDNRPFNNAFIMTMGDLVAVEFSGESNAFYGYSVKRTLPFDFTKSLRSAPVNGKNSLKNDARVLYLTHKDNVHGYSDWEDRFEAELQDKFGLVLGQQAVRRVVVGTAPAGPPLAPERRFLSNPASEVYSEENVRRLAERYSATIADRREKGGAFWLVMGNTPEVRRILRAWGFQYVDGKGWWKRDAG